MSKKQNSNASGIVLYAKHPGCTSFSSLFSIKKALNTTKVGHTGTLDSFAEGLLVVCVGNHTRLAGKITGFSKRYEAIIAFGTETDTLEYTGNPINQTNLPTLKNLQKSLENFTGDILQAPPAFSAVHVDGKRASDLARVGKSFEIPKRPVTVFEAKILDVIFEDEINQTVKYAKINFFVSKGTYIRCLARDIAKDCGSSAHLIGLLRTEVGSFKLEDAVGKSLLKNFTIENAIKNAENWKKQKNEEFSCKSKNEKTQIEIETENKIKIDIQNSLKKMDKNLAKECDFYPVSIKKEYEDDFFTGKFLKSKCFSEEILPENRYAVFTEEGDFCGEVYLENRKIKYGFVIPKEILA